MSYVKHSASSIPKPKIKRRGNMVDVPRTKSCRNFSCAINRVAPKNQASTKLSKNRIKTCRWD